MAQIWQARKNNSAWLRLPDSAWTWDEWRPRNRPKYTGPSPVAKTAGIGPQSRRQEMKHLASTGPSLGTETEPTPPDLGHNHSNQNGTLSRHWSDTGYWNWADTGLRSCHQELKHLAGTGPNQGTETGLTPPALGHNQTDKKWKT